MDDRDFFDTLYAGWAKTTGAEDTYWQPVEHDHLPADNRCRFSVDAVDKDQGAIRVAAGLTEADAAFITAVHGCFGDLVRRLHHAIDDADRFEEQRDEQEVRIAELATENEELKKVLEMAGRSV